MDILQIGSLITFTSKKTNKSYEGTFVKSSVKFPNIFFYDLVNVRQLGTEENEVIAYASVLYSEIESIHVTGTVERAPIDPAIYEMRILEKPRTSDPVSDNGSNHSPNASIHSQTISLSDHSPDAEKPKVSSGSEFDWGPANNAMGDMVRSPIAGPSNLDRGNNHGNNNQGRNNNESSSSYSPCSTNSLPRSSSPALTVSSDDSPAKKKLKESS